MRVIAKENICTEWNWLNHNVEVVEREHKRANLSRFAEIPVDCFIAFIYLSLLSKCKDLAKGAVKSWHDS